MKVLKNRWRKVAVFCLGGIVAYVAFHLSGSIIAAGIVVVLASFLIKD